MVEIWCCHLVLNLKQVQHVLYFLHCRQGLLQEQEHLMDLGVSDLSTLHLWTMYLGNTPDKHGEPFHTIQSFIRTDHLAQVWPIRRTGTLTLDQKMVRSVHLPTICRLCHHLINYPKGKRSSGHLGSPPFHLTTSWLPMPKYYSAQDPEGNSGVS
jgi:hypothetical protein